MFTLILISILVILFTIYCKHRYSYWEKRGLKTPKIIPFFGTLLDETKEEPRKTEERYLKELGPVFGTYFCFTPVLNTSKIEHIKEVLGDLKRFPNQATVEFNDKYLQHSMFFKSDKNWKEQRQVQTHYFTSRKFKNLLNHFEQCSKNLLDNIETIRKESKTGDVDAKMISKYYGCDVISKVLFAIDIDSYKEKNNKLVKNIMTMGDLNTITATIMTIIPKRLSKFLGLNAFNTIPMDELGDYFIELLKERRKNGIKYNDLSELLQDASDENKIKITQEEVIGNMILAFFAGIEPVSNATSQMLYFLSKHEDIQEKLRKEIFKEFSNEIDYEKLTQNQYLDAFFNESMRLGGNVLVLTRTCSEETKLGDLHLEKGTEIKIITAVPHTNSDHYSNPHTFNPDRWLKNGNSDEVKEGSMFAPFGYGHKQCLGMRLAQLEAKYLVIRILQNYKVSQPVDKEIISEYFRGFINRKVLKIRLDKLS